MLWLKDKKEVVSNIISLSKLSAVWYLRGVHHNIIACLFMMLMLTKRPCFMLHAARNHIFSDPPLFMPFLIFLGASFPFTYERDHAEAHISVRWILACSMISVDNYWYFFSKINRPIQKAVEPPSQLNHGTIQVERSWKTTVKNFIIFVSSSHCSSAWAWSDCGS